MVCFLDIYKNDFYAQKTIKKTWIESYTECTTAIVARRSQILDDSPLDTNGNYWLANTRRFIKQVSASRGMYTLVGRHTICLPDFKPGVIF